MTAVSLSRTTRGLPRLLKLIMAALPLLAFCVLLRVGPLGLARNPTRSAPR